MKGIDAPQLIHVLVHCVIEFSATDIKYACDVV